MKFQFEMATRLHFGEGKLPVLAQEAEGFGLKRWLLVSAPQMEKLGNVKRIAGMLKDAGRELLVYAGVDRKPDDTHVTEGLAVFRQNSCQGVVALGGGSSLDAGKAIAGTGSEVTRAAGIGDTGTRIKMVIISPTMAVINAGVCLVHGMSRPLGAYFHMPHGRGNAILLPHVMRYSVERMENPERYARMAAALGEPVEGLSVK